MYAAEYTEEQDLEDYYTNEVDSRGSDELGSKGGVC